jgi:hypothetical protein
MKIRYINVSLAEQLGFENTNELIDRCWLDFIDPSLHAKIKSVHRALLTSFKNEYNEYTNEIVGKDKQATKVRWLNTSINHTTNWTFSIGIPDLIDLENVTGDEIRTQFKSLIASDRTMIRTLKEYIKGVPQSHDLPDTCDLTEE